MRTSVSGVYWIRNKITEELYIGSSVDVRQRRRLHKSTLRRGISKNVKLQDAVNVYGLSNFSFRLLITCHPTMLAYYEYQFLQIFNPIYNISTRSVGLHNTNIDNPICTDKRLSCKKKIKKTDTGISRSEAKKLWWSNEDNKRKMSEIQKIAQLGKKMSVESREKMSLALIGNTRTKGKKMSNDTKKKISNARRKYLKTLSH